MSDMPIFRIQLEGLRYAIQTALGDHNKELSNLVNSEMKRYFELGGIVKDVREAIQEAMPRICKRVLWNANVENVIVDALTKQLTK